MDKWEILSDYLHTMMEGDKRSLTHPTETDRYDDGYYDGIYAVIQKMEELES